MKKNNLYSQNEIRKKVERLAEQMEKGANQWEKWLDLGRSIPFHTIKLLAQSREKWEKVRVCKEIVKLSQQIEKNSLEEEYLEEESKKKE